MSTQFNDWVSVGLHNMCTKNRGGRQILSEAEDASKGSKRHVNKELSCDFNIVDLFEENIVQSSKWERIVWIQESSIHDITIRWINNRKDDKLKEHAILVVPWTVLEIGQISILVRLCDDPHTLTSLSCAYLTCSLMDNKLNNLFSKPELQF